MAGFEDVIVRALEKHEYAPQEVRDQIYNSARTALAGLLEKSDNLDLDTIHAQQQRLEQAIDSIESQYSAYEQDHQQIVEPPFEESYDEVAPEVSATEAVTPVADDPYYESLDDDRNQSRRRPFAKLLFTVIIIAALGMAAWWSYDQGLFQSAAMRDTSVPNPPTVLAGETSKDQAPATSNWINVFEPGDPRGLIVGESATAELGRDTGGEFVSLKGSKSSKGAIKVVIEPGVMETMRGRKATFELKVKSASGQDHQILVSCQFKQLGNCGRKRFTVGRAAESFIFAVMLENNPVQGDDKTGLLTILTDISDAGNVLDLYAIRVKVE